MTPAILPNLLACVPAQPVAVSETAGPSAGAGQGAGIDFSALLLALLPDCAPPPAPPAIPIEPQAANGKAETQGEPEPEDPPRDQRSKEPDPAAAPVTLLGVPVPIIPGAPAPAVSFPGKSEATPDGAGEVRATEATGPARIPSSPAADRQAPDKGPCAAPVAARIQLPQGFEAEAAESVFAIQPETESSAAVEEEPAPADRGARAAEADPAPNAPKQGPRNAEMAFAARLTAAPQAPATSAAARGPELHIAMPPEMRAAGPETERGPAAPAPARGPEPHITMPSEMRPAGPETERGPAAPAAARAPEPQIAMPSEMRPAGPEAERGPAAPSRAGAPAAPVPQPDLNQVAQGGPAPANVRPESVPAQKPGAAPEPPADMLPPIERAEARAQQAPVPQAQARTDDDPVPQAQAPAAQAEVKSRAAGSDSGTAPEPRPDRPGAGPRGMAGGEGAGAPVMHWSESTAAPVPRQTAPRERAAVLSTAAEVIEVQPGRAEQARPQALRELSVVLPGRTSEGGKAEPQVQIRIIEDTGDVRVAVRTADSRLTSSLREDLPQLVSQLADRGYRAETWHPAAAPPAGDGRPMRAESSEPGSGGDRSGSPGRGGSDTAGRDGNGGRREQEQKQPEWLDALERSLGRDGAPIRSIL